MRFPFLLPVPPLPPTPPLPCLHDASPIPRSLVELAPPRRTHSPRRRNRHPRLGHLLPPGGPRWRTAPSTIRHGSFVPSSAKRRPRSRCPSWGPRGCAEVAKQGTALADVVVPEEDPAHGVEPSGGPPGCALPDVLLHDAVSSYAMLRTPPRSRILQLIPSYMLLPRLCSQRQDSVLASDAVPLVRLRPRRRFLAPSSSVPVCVFLVFLVRSCWSSTALPETRITT
ncbi:hypothetical protein PVAP13_7KG123755 [Panicum virgatum]|uniref:Uncharacterized protein n=1 Tax=Panicum virgatum TaxID=38727 RepID=A0A8T0QAS6_PANVG|nr:hypothetical protein PVAP13_7KG123755 [Panicum virgatum]KAG2571971.1 hypothetical protein PVAP13_7KG123755 [Panicum virgatum]